MRGPPSQPRRLLRVLPPRVKGPDYVPWLRYLHLSSVAQPFAVTRWRDFLQFAQQTRRVSAGRRSRPRVGAGLQLTGFPGRGPGGAPGPLPYDAATEREGRARTAG